VTPFYDKTGNQIINICFWGFSFEGVL
jgi:hypothetical protein